MNYLLRFYGPSAGVHYLSVFADSEDRANDIGEQMAAEMSYGWSFERVVAGWIP